MFDDMCEITKIVATIRLPAYSAACLSIILIQFVMLPKSKRLAYTKFDISATRLTYFNW